MNEGKKEADKEDTTFEFEDRRERGVAVARDEGKGRTLCATCLLPFMLPSLFLFEEKGDLNLAMKKDGQQQEGKVEEHQHSKKYKRQPFYLSFLGMFLSWRVFTSTLALILRLASGGVALRGQIGRRPVQPLRLYEYEGCPYCRKVREALSMLDLEVIILPCPKGGKRYELVNNSYDSF